MSLAKGKTEIACVIMAFFIGAGFSGLRIVWYYFVPPSWPLTEIALSAVTYLIVLAVLCETFKSYRRCLSASVASTIGCVAMGLTNAARTGQLNFGVPRTPLIILTLIVSLGIAVVTFGTLCIIRRIQQVFYPVYPHGHCQKCGYNLRGLVKNRCPECAEEFGPEHESVGELS